MRNWFLSISLLCALATCLAITNCGSSSNNASGNCTTPNPAYNVLGNWTLSYTNNGTVVSDPGVITAAGLPVFVQTTSAVPAPGDTVVFPTITGGATCFSGAGTAYSTPASGGGGGTTVVTAYTVSGTIDSNTSITGMMSGQGNFSMAPNTAVPSSITALSGSYFGQIEGAAQTDILQLTLAPASGGNPASMTVSGTDGQSCTVSGTFDQERFDTGTLGFVVNVFDVSITLSGASCPVSGLTGVGFESTTDYFGFNSLLGSAATTYFYAASSSSASVMEIYQPGCPECGTAGVREKEN